MTRQRPPDRARIVFFGLPEAFSARTLQAFLTSGLEPILVVEGVPGPPSGGLRGESRRYWAQTRRWPAWTPRGPRPSSNPTKSCDASVLDLVETARAASIDGVRTRNPHDPQLRRWLGSVHPDLFVVCGFPYPIPGSTLRLPRKGGLRLHPGRLPEDRGPAPVFWALKEGRTKVGWTIHVLDVEPDAGDWVARGEHRFEPGVRSREVLEAVAISAIPSLIRATRAVLDGDLVRTPQAPAGTPRGPQPRFRDGRIDPGRSAEAVYTFVAGCADGYPLFVEIGGDRFFVEKAIAYERERRLPVEYMLAGDELWLQCHPGVVKLSLRPGGALFCSSG